MAFIRKRNLAQGWRDMDAFDDFDTSGIAGTQMEDTLSFDVARWLVKRMPGEIEIAWDNYEPGRELAAPVRASCRCSKTTRTSRPTRVAEMLEAASGRIGADPAWLIQRFSDLPIPPLQKAELYASLRAPLRWNLGNSSLTRTRNWKPVRSVITTANPTAQD